MLEEKEIRALLERYPEHGHLYSTTACYWEGCLSRESLEALAEKTGRAEGLIENSRICIVYGYGSQLTTTYRKLQTLHGLEVVWNGNFGPWWLSPLFLVTACRGGLIRILEVKVIENVLLRLADLAMVELFSFSSELYSELLESIHKNKWRSFPGLIASKDDAYFCLGIDGDSSEVNTGIFGWCSYGPNCPSSLSGILRESTAPT